MTQLYDVSQDFYRFESCGRSPTEFSAKFKRMYEEINSLLHISADIKKMQEQRAQLAVMGFLSSTWTRICSKILSCTTVPSQILRASQERKLMKILAVFRIFQTL